MGAGENWDAFVGVMVMKKLYGLENLSLIPGTVGAAPVQNIGAYGTEVKETISQVEVFDMKSGETRLMSNEACEFRYRDSIFKQPEGAGLVVTKVFFTLFKSGSPEARVNIGYKDVKEFFKDRYSKEVTPDEVRKVVIEIRTRKLPDVKKVGTAGSFFKNPILSANEFERVQVRVKALAPDLEMPTWSESGGRVKVSFAWILDKLCGMRGWRDGAVGAYENQALVLVNFGGGTADEVTRAAHRLADAVREKTGIEAEWEVRMMK